MEDNIKFLLDKLSSISSTLRVIGLLISLFTIVNVLLMVTKKMIPEYITSASLSSLVVILILLTVFDVIKRNAQTYYDVICTEIGWKAEIVDRKETVEMSKEETLAKPAGKIPDIAIRTILRQYVQSKNLPLFPGALGLPIIGFINFFLVLMLIKG